MPRSIFWTFYNILLLSLLCLVWFKLPFIFLILATLLILVTIYPDKYLLYFMKMSVVSKHYHKWVLRIPIGLNVLKAENCHYYPEDKLFVFKRDREFIELVDSEQYYILIYLLIKKTVNFMPNNFFRFLFVPITVILYFYQITAKVFLVKKERFENLPSLMFGQDILTILRL